MKNYRLPGAAALGFLASMAAGRAPAQEGQPDVAACKQQFEVLEKDRELLIPQWQTARAIETHKYGSFFVGLQNALTSAGNDVLETNRRKGESDLARCGSDPVAATSDLKTDDYMLRQAVTADGGLTVLPPVPKAGRSGPDMQ